MTQNLTIEIYIDKRHHVTQIEKFSHAGKLVRSHLISRSTSSAATMHALYKFAFITRLELLFRHSADASYSKVVVFRLNALQTTQTLIARLQNEGKILFSCESSSETITF